MDSQLLAAARRMNRRAVEQLLEEHFPVVYRMAMALCGREDAGRAVLRFVMQRCLYVLPKWTQESAAERWFHHHTVLAARRTAQHQPDAHQDLLVVRAEGTDAGYVAFVRALRGLPRQQMEAFILSQGERWNERYLGVAMDCSVQAAANHLKAAVEALSAVSSERFEIYAKQLANAYAHLTPPAEVIVPMVHSQVRRHLWPRRIKRAILWLIILAALAAAAWAAWRWREAIPGLWS